MNRLEAQERAKKIWGPNCNVTRSFQGNTQPGKVEWWVDKNTKNPSMPVTNHGLDCNGHPTCHKECMAGERSEPANVQSVEPANVQSVEPANVQGGDECVIISADRPIEYGTLDGNTIKVRK
jgi:hypothetical protein